MHFSLNEAARQVTASKTTILRAIKSGKLSARLEGSTYQIEASELFRVFDPLGVQRVPPDGPEGGPRDTSDGPAPMDKDSEIAMLRALLAAEERRSEELRIERDRWAVQAERLLLTSAPPVPSNTIVPVATSGPSEEKAPLISRLIAAIKG